MERLAFVTEHLHGPQNEGSLNTAIQLTRALAAKVSQLRVFTRYPSNTETVVASHLPKNKLFLSREFLAQFRRFKPQAVIYLPSASGTAGGFLRGYILKLLSNGTKTALIYLQPRHLSAATRILARVPAVDIVFAQSRRSVQSLQDAGFQARWIPGGVDSARFVPAAATRRRDLRMKYSLPENAKIVLHVGHLNRGRNIQELVRLQANGHCVLLVTSSRFDTDAELGKMFVQAGGRIISDYVDHIEEIYQLADVYVFPTFREINAIETPLSVLEAMSSNLPIVTTRFGSLAEMFQTSDGFFFYEDPADLSSLIDHAMHVPVCKTRDMVRSHGWDEVSNRILTGLKDENL